MDQSSQSTEPLTVDSFLKAVLRSGLLERDQLQEALRGVPVDDRGNSEAVANRLVKLGKLSRFQAGKLLRGRAMGLVLGPFQVLAPIGKGGTGTVYLAKDMRSQQRQQLVALKVLPPQKAKNEERLLARFRREMELCQRVSHPNLAWTYEVGVCQGAYYIAMEYVPGKSLYRLVADEGPLTVPRAARLFAEVAAAIEHAHSQGLIHRDLKPSNIHVTPHDHAVVLDLGLALIQGENGADREVVGGQGYVVGTMDYVAPEQTEDACKIDARADIYGLGATLYYTLTGRPPFPGGTSIEKIHRHRGEEPTPIQELNPAIPAGFAAIVHKMLAKQPDKRYATTTAVREELLRWVAGEPELPMDEPDDREYVDAVATLESAEPVSDFEEELVPFVEPVAVAEVIPVSKLIRVAGPKPVPHSKRTVTSQPMQQPSIETLPIDIPQSTAASKDNLFIYLLIAAGALLLGFMTLAGVALLFWMRK